MQIRSRLAPTPSGLLHSGNGLSFLLTWGLVRAWGGSLVLRIDDLDASRTRTAYVEDIFRTIEWLGIEYDEGPADVASFRADWSQQLRLARYARAIERLREAGDLFACTCSRRQIREQSTDGRYPRTCRERQLDFEAPQTAWRIRVDPVLTYRQPAWPEPEVLLRPGSAMGDFVLRRKNGLPAYQLASLMDDLEMDINLIVRGEDLLDSTAAQRHLAERLGARAFARAICCHHPLLTDEQGNKLSKSQGAGSLAAWREAGRRPAELLPALGAWLDMAGSMPDRVEDLPEAIRQRWPNPGREEGV